jgi:hypothetical protein
MSGIPQFNFPLFNAVARILRDHGHTVFNPAAKDIERHGGVDISAGNDNGDVAKSATEHGFSLREALGDDTHFISLKASGIVLLPGWEFSNGTMAEWFLARAIAKDPNNKVPFRFVYVQRFDDTVIIPGIATFTLEPAVAAA